MATLGTLESAMAASAHEIRIIPTATPPNMGVVTIDSESIKYMRVDWDGNVLVLKNLIRTPVDMSTHLAGVTVSIGNDVQLKAPKYIHMSATATGGDDISYTTTVGNSWICNEIDIHRTDNTAITLEIHKIIDGVEYLQIEETGWTGTDYSIPISLDCSGGEEIRVETTGSAAGNIYILINGTGIL